MREQASQGKGTTIMLSQSQKFVKSRDDGVVFVDLRLTRPSKSIPRLDKQINESGSEPLEELFSPVKNSRDIPEEPPRYEVGRRANPGKRKIAKERREFPNGVDVPPASKVLFGDIKPDELRRLHAMITNFLILEDGSMTNDVNLHLYGSDAGVTVTNITVQEMCTIQPNLTRLDLTNCMEVSDVGLWAIAKHCTAIQHLVLSGCNQITNIGLRSISLRCCHLETMNFNNCHLLDDLGLTVVATGVWQLRELHLRGCRGITDTGVGRLAKTCHRLEVLDLNGCAGVGEFGDHALKELATYCGNLRELDLSGCKRVEDSGLRALAVGCVRLQKLLLSGCSEITGKGLKSLCKHARGMHTLSLIGCAQLTDRDLNSFTDCCMANTLTCVDLSGCRRITDDGIACLCKAVGPALNKLSLAGCSATDFSAMIIANMCCKLRELDMSNCSLISDDTVHTIANKVTALTTLRLDNLPQISLRALVSHLGHSLEFADMAHTWFGYKPKENVDELIMRREKRREEHSSVVLIQCCMRRKKAYKVYKAARRIWLLDNMIPRVQALVRGFIQRKRWVIVQRHILRVRMAVRVQSWFRKCQRMFERVLIVKKHRYAVHRDRMARRIQRVYWGMLGRRRVKLVRVEQANVRLQAAQAKARREIKAIVIQRFYKAHAARCRVAALASEREKRRDRLLTEERSVRLIQRIAHGKLGRLRAHRRDLFLKHEYLRFCSAWAIQRVFRGHIGRNYAKVAARIKKDKLRNKCAGIIQRNYRGYRGRLLSSIARALRVLRSQQKDSAVQMQKVVRGHMGRVRAYEFREKEIIRRRQSKACVHIQRLYRGHKGREAREIEQQLASLDQQARPLIELLKTLEGDGVKLNKLISRMEYFNTRSEGELDDIEREVAQCLVTNNKYTDCSRINNTPQRFLTKYLRVRLKDHYEHEKELHRVKFIELQTHRVELRNLERRIEFARRELIPLTTGKVAAVKRERTKRLRAYVRHIRKAVVTIQSLWRRALVRVALKDVAMDYWIECYDAEQGEESYYYNTWTRQTAWKIPLAYKYFHRKVAGETRMTKQQLEEQLEEQGSGAGSFYGSASMSHSLHEESS